MSESSSTHFSDSESAGASEPPISDRSIDDWQEWVDGGVRESEHQNAQSSERQNHASIPASPWSSTSIETAAPERLPPEPLSPEPFSPETLSYSATQQLPQSPVALVETAFLASTTSLLWLINSYFPLGPVWRICFPIPIALVYLRWNRRAAWMATAVSMLLLMVFTGPVRSLFFLMPSGLLGVLLGFCWRRKASWGVSIFLGTLINTLGFFFRVALTSVLLNEDLWIYVTTQVTKLLNWVSIQLGLLFQPDLSIVQLLAVVLVLVNSVIYLFAVHLAAWFLLKRLGAQVSDPPRWVQVMLELEVE